MPFERLPLWWMDTIPLDLAGLILPGHRIMAGVRRDPSLPSPSSPPQMPLEPPREAGGPVNGEAPSSDSQAHPYQGLRDPLTARW